MKRTAAVVLAFIAATALAALAAQARAASSPSTWKPWQLSSPAQFRLAPPLSARSMQTKLELRRLHSLQGRRGTKANRALIAKWLNEPAVVPWMQAALQAIVVYRPRVAPAARSLAILGAGMEDAVIAATDSRLAYANQGRPAPYRLDRTLKPAVTTSAARSYAPTDAAIAGAAETILPYLFPNAPASTFTKMGDEVVRARELAGVDYPSDLVRARALGRKVGALFTAYGETDNHGASGFSEGPFTGEQFWEPTPISYEPPVGGAVGSWKPWVVPDYHQFLGTIPPPSPYGSPAFIAQLNAVLSTSAGLTDEQKRIATFWDDEPGTFTPPGHWMDIALRYIKSYKTSDADAARIVAYLGASLEDSVITWFGIKYHYWQVRPITAIWRLSADRTHVYSEAEIAANPSLAPLRNVWTPFIPTPAFPSYPAGHPTFSGDAAKLLTYFFPTAGDTLNQLADQVALARVYGGIHYPEDVDQALVLGHAIADDFIARAQEDTSSR